MKLGVRAHDLGRMEPFVLAKKLKDVGFETCQLALPKAINAVETIYDVSDRVLAQVKEAFLENQVDIGVLGCYMEIGLSYKEARLEEVEKFKRGITHAKELSAGIIGTETSNCTALSDKERESAYQNLKDSVLRMVDFAEQQGVTIGIEPVAWHTLNSTELTRRLLDEVGSKRLKLIFDPVNLIRTKDDIENQEVIFDEFLKILGENIAALHVKDIVFEDGNIIWKNIGKGDIVYGKIFDWLKKNNNDIPVLREELKEQSAEIDINEMKRLMKGSEGEG